MRIKMRLSKRDFVDVNSENIPIGPTANPVGIRLRNSPNHF